MTLGALFTVIEAERVKMEITALTRKKYSWKPPANHPWKRHFFIKKPKVKQLVSVEK